MILELNSQTRQIYFLEFERSRNVNKKISREVNNLPEILLEIRRLGKSLRVIAIDPTTGTEVTMVAPASATRAVIKRNAAQKLAYVIAKKRVSKKL